MLICLPGGMSASAIPYNNSVGDGIYDVPKKIKNPRTLISSGGFNYLI